MTNPFFFFATVRPCFRAAWKTPFACLLRCGISTLALSIKSGQLELDSVSNDNTER